MSISLAGTFSWESFTEFLGGIWNYLGERWVNLWAIEEFRLLIWATIGLFIFVLISYFLMRKSRDRCVKEFESYHVQSIMAGEEGDPIRDAYSGVLEVPINASNGFEVHYDLEWIENLPQLFSYLKSAGSQTKNSKYDKVIESIRQRLSEQGKTELESEYRLNPFDPPPEASHKVYQEDLEKLLVIVRFFDELPELEMKARLGSLENFFHPGFVRRTSRNLGNFLSFAWDRVKQIATMITGYFTKGKAADMQKVTTDTQTKIFTYTPRKYEALLENSIGYLVKAKVISPEGKLRFYRGVLKEYSTNYICLYNVFYRLPRAAEYEDGKFLGLDKKSLFRCHGKPVTRDQDIELTFNKSGDVMKLKNISDHYIFLSKVDADGQPLSGFSELIHPDRTQSLPLPTPAKRIRLEYEEAFSSDVVLPRKYAVIVGKAEPRLPNVEKLKKFANKVKKVPISNIKDFQYNIFTTNNSNEGKRQKGGSEDPIIKALPEERNE